MGNCCGGGDYPGEGATTGRTPSSAGTPSGAPPPKRMTTPDEDERREQQRKAAEQRVQQAETRGTQRPVSTRKQPKPIEAINKGGPDISDWS